MKAISRYELNTIDYVATSSDYASFAFIPIVSSIRHSPKFEESNTNRDQTETA